MRIHATQATTQGNLDAFTSTQCSFDAEGTSMLMSILSGLYTDVPLAVVREYVTNALDSHAQAGVDEPVEVSLPTDLDPTLAVTDHGLGLSADEVSSVFGVYGRSTKRDTDDQVGAFGIGSKSAFAETGQFTVTAVKDGLRTMVLFRLDDQGIGNATTIVQGAPTSERNGVSVAIPVQNATLSRAAVQKVAAYIPSGSLLLDGEPNTCVLDDADRIDDHAVLVPRTNQRRRTVHVVSGGIRYDLDQSTSDRAERILFDHMPYARSKVLHLVAPLGAVQPAPARETLRDTPATREWIEGQLRSLPARIAAARNALCEGADTPAQAVTLLDNSPHNKVAPFTWRGQEFAATMTPSGPVLELNDDRARPISSLKPTLVPADAAKKIAVVVGSPSLDAVRKYATKVMMDRGWAILAVEDADSGQDGWLTWGPGVPEVDVVSFEQFARAGALLTTPNNAESGTTRSVRTFTVHLPDTNVEFALTKAAVVAVAKEYGGRLGFSTGDFEREGLAARFPVLSVASKRAPAASWSQAGLEPLTLWDYSVRLKVAQEYLSSLTDVQRDRVTLGVGFNETCKRAEELLDPRLRAAAKAKVAIPTYIHQYGFKHTDVLHAYPLASSVWRQSETDAVIDYVNALYLYRQHKDRETPAA